MKKIKQLLNKIYFSKNSLKNLRKNLLIALSVISCVQTTQAEMTLSEQPTSGWHDMPEIFEPYFKYHRYNLQYDAGSKYLRNFRENRVGRESNMTHVSWESLKLKSSTPEEIKKCWGIFVSGGYCGKPLIEPAEDNFSETGELDLLKYSRLVSQHNGLAVARDMLVEKIRLKDASQGVFQHRIIETTKDENLVYSDSLFTIPAEQRKDIGIYLVLGIGGENNLSSALIKSAANKLKSMGFQAEMLMVDPELGSDHNALMLKDMLSERIPKLKKVVLVAASKGVADFITYFLNYGDSLSLQDREKVKLMVSLAGVIRPSFVAKFLRKSYSPVALFVGAALTLTGRSNEKIGIESLSKNPWKNHDYSSIKTNFPNLKWLSMPAIPEGLEGVTHRSLWESFLKTPTYNYNDDKASPMDGLVESAASILPPGTNLTEYIVPIYGPHTIALGYYTPTLKVAPKAQHNIDDTVVPEAGAEMLSAIFRALPLHLID